MHRFIWNTCSAKPNDNIKRCNNRLYCFDDNTLIYRQNLQRCSECGARSICDEETNTLYCEACDNSEPRIHHDNHNLCKIHYKKLYNKSSIQLWNGVVLNIDKPSKSIVSSTNRIQLYRNLYLTSLNNKDYMKYDMLVNLQHISSGSRNTILEDFITLGAFKSSDHVFSFFKNTPKKKLNDTLRFFYGIFYYYTIKPQKLIFLQRTIRMHIYYKKHIKAIIKIQRFIRHTQWLSSLIIPPERLRNVFYKNIDKVRMIQRNIRIFISKTQSHGCPYTLDTFNEISKKHRVHYSYIINNKKHNFYFNIKWLHIDWLIQLENKTFLVNPGTKQEIPNNFIEEIAIKVHLLIEKGENICINDNCSKIHIYDKEEHWTHEIQRRSFYSFCFMLLEITDILNRSVSSIEDFYKNLEVINFYDFFVSILSQVLEYLYNTPNNSACDDIQNIRIHIQKSMFKQLGKRVYIGIYMKYIIDILNTISKNLDSNVFVSIRNDISVEFGRCFPFSTLNE